MSTRKESTYKWHHCMEELWGDIHNTGVSPDEINLSSYTDKWHIGHCPKSILLPYVTGMMPPTIDDAEAAKAKCRKYEGERAATLMTQPSITESQAVDFLLKTGRYRIMKRDWVEVTAQQ